MTAVPAYAWEIIGNTGRVVEHWRFDTDGAPLVSVLERGDGSVTWSTWKPADGETAEIYGCVRGRRHRAPDVETARQSADNVLRNRGVVVTVDRSPGYLERQKAAERHAAEQRTATAVAGATVARVAEERELARAALSYLEGRIPASTVGSLIEMVAGLAALGLAEAELAVRDKDDPQR